ncbi:MAG: hypothetical protein GX043_03465 [Desulfovibrionales bacterium]|jgi:hypothetical protein|nr:hypothetical protein [Desulfovibrionales bacterium]
MKNSNNQHNPQSLSEDDSELLIVNDNEDHTVVRQSFRVPVPSGMVTFGHAGKRYTVIDLSMYGIGVAVDAPDAFIVGDVIQKSEIVFPDASFSVDVEIIHISPHPTEALLCGMEIVHTHDSGFIDWMTRVIAEIKSTLFTSTGKP